MNPKTYFIDAALRGRLWSQVLAVSLAVVAFAGGVGVAGRALAQPMFPPASDGAGFDFDDAPAPSGAAPAARPRPRVAAPRLPRIGPIPMARPWGNRDAFAPEPEATEVAGAPAPETAPVASLAAPSPAPSPALTPALTPAPGPVARVEPVPAAPVAPVAVAPAPVSPPTASVEPPRGAAAPVAPARPSELARPKLPEPNIVVARAMPPEPRVAMRPLTGLAARPEASQAIVFLVRPGLNEAQDLEGSRISLGALGAASDSVRRTVSAAVRKAVITADVTAVSDVERLVRGDVDAILVGIGPALSDSALGDVWVGAYRLMQIPLK